MKIKLYIFLLFISANLLGQQQTVKFDSISKNDIILFEIDLEHGNSYRFKTFIETDSLIFVMPQMLPKGYYEAYYLNDSNLLAFAFYNFGNKSYSQQFYMDGSMKSDSEYDKYGNLHGLHVIYDRIGNEIWHSDYWHGEVEPMYTKKYLERFNATSKLISNAKAFGCYVFWPSPMRERHDEILLSADGSFSFHNYKANCDCERHSIGNWRLENGLLKLSAENPKIWSGAKEKTFAIIAKNSRNPVLVEYCTFGLNLYGSEFYKCKKCKCFKN